TRAGKKGLITFEITSPMVSVRCKRKLLADALGLYPNFCITVRTRWRVSLETGRVSLITCETVAMETAAYLATSFIVGSRVAVFRTSSQENVLRNRLTIKYHNLFLPVKAYLNRPTSILHLYNCA